MALVDALYARVVNRTCPASSAFGRLRTTGFRIGPGLKFSVAQDSA